MAIGGDGWIENLQFKLCIQTPLTATVAVFALTLELPQWEGSKLDEKGRMKDERERKVGLIAVEGNEVS
jgi:hypothetical protein